MGWTIGVDVGGTFTDFYAINNDNGDIRVSKRPSTPSNPAEAILLGLGELSKEHDIPLNDVSRLGHGTTVGTNALIQRRGATVAVITVRVCRPGSRAENWQRGFGSVAEHPRVAVVRRSAGVSRIRKILDDGHKRVSAAGDDVLYSAS